MFDELEFEEVGRILKTHGVKGQLKVRLNELLNTNIIKGCEPVFIFFKGIPVPFFLEDYSQTGQSQIIKLKFVDNIARAEELCGLDIFTTEPTQNSIVDTDENSILSYQVYSKYHGHIGYILNINEIPGNPVLEIQNNQNIIFVPFVDDFIEEINHQEKFIKIIPPEGLIELYL